VSRTEVLVDAAWVQAHSGGAGVVLVEVDEDTAAYDKGHIEGTVKIDWTGSRPTRTGTSSSTGIPTSGCSTAAGRNGNWTHASW
jgi:3-mercaptopyruvate sulfurtransferase SseA